MLVGLKQSETSRIFRLVRILDTLDTLDSERGYSRRCNCETSLVSVGSG